MPLRGRIVRPEGRTAKSADPRPPLFLYPRIGKPSVCHFISKTAISPLSAIGVYFRPSGAASRTENHARVHFATPMVMTQELSPLKRFPGFGAENRRCAGVAAKTGNAERSGLRAGTPGRKRLTGPLFRQSNTQILATATTRPGAHAPTGVKTA